jgi:hypothetical protein
LHDSRALRTFLLLTCFKTPKLSVGLVSVGELAGTCPFRKRKPGCCDIII